MKTINLRHEVKIVPQNDVFLFIKMCKNLMLQGVAVLCGGHIGGHIVLENVRYFTVNCGFRKIGFGYEKSPKP